MIRVNKVLLTLCFALALGCGETSSGQSENTSDKSVVQEATASAGQPAAQEQQIAALTETAKATSTDGLSSVNYVEGTHYEKLPRPVPTVDNSRIEVAEVFWYGCGHCYHFEPLFQKWKSGVADDVVVVKSPAMWDNGGVMANHARIYYTAKALGVLDQVSPAAFRALNVDQNPLRTEDAIAQLFVENGVSREDFDKTFNSFGVTSSVRQAEARQRSYRVQGTPEVVVNGLYRVSTRMAGSQEAMLKVADFLVEKIRKEKASNAG